MRRLKPPSPHLTPQTLSEKGSGKRTLRKPQLRPSINAPFRAVPDRDRARVATPEKMTALRQPPIVGKTYLVPTIAGEAYGVRAIMPWPVLGTPHPIKEGASRLLYHWHVDLRFLDDEQESFARSYHEETEAPFAVNELLAEGGRFVVAWKQLVCRHAQPWAIVPDSIVAARFPCAVAKRTRTGRLLCPHERADLSQFGPNSDGTVTCPLHGLKVGVRNCLAA